MRLCFALFLLRKEQDGIHMPRGLVDDLEGEVIGEKVHERTLWHDILSADLYCEYTGGLCFYRIGYYYPALKEYALFETKPCKDDGVSYALRILEIL